MQNVLLVSGIAVLIFMIYRLVSVYKMTKAPLVDDHENVLTLTDQNFQQRTKGKVILVDFWASWCAPCRMMAPVLNDVASELSGNSHVGKVDIQQYQNLATEFKIRNIPTIVLFKDGKEVNRFVGIKSKEFLLKEIAKVS